MILYSLIACVIPQGNMFVKRKYIPSVIDHVSAVNYEFKPRLRMASPDLSLVGGS